MLQKSIMPVLHNCFSIFKMLQPAPRDCGPKEQRSRKQRSSGAAEQRSSGRHGMLSVVTISGATGTITTTSDSTAPRAFPPLPVTAPRAFPLPAPRAFPLPILAPRAHTSAHSTSAGFGRARVSEAFAVLARACMHHRYATSAHARLRAPLTDMHASGSARSLARGISRYVPHTRFFLCGYCLASLLARGGRGAVHASAPSRKSPTELEDHAGGPAANAEG